jgi:2-polyprenyl-3-methyl-5-hydroxy-6-metoxy-1,4-benzoquinol methylase
MRTHYEQLLSPIYRWMLGDFDSALERSRKELEELGIGRASEGARGLDLGAGLGLQTIPLVRLGYLTTAIDASEELLSELSSVCPEANAVHGDLLDADTLAPGAYDVVVCMGDTLTHLPSREDVARLLASVRRKLSPHGTLALTFRDYASRVREATDRFILVRAGAERILTCCLDYGPEHVQVTDIVHERSGAGWALRASAYPKLRLSREWVTEQLERNGLAITLSSTDAGKISIVARPAL